MHNIIWFRSDLRTSDNPALYAAMQAKTAPSRGLFIVSLKQWQNHDWGANKIGFVLHSVVALEQELAKLKIPLDILYSNTFKDIPKILLNYLHEQKAQELYYNHEYELNETQRDIAVTKLLSRHKIPCKSFHSQALIQPGLILTKQNTPYTVFTPFKKACYEHLHKTNINPSPKPKAQNLATNTNMQIKELINTHQVYLNSPALQQWRYGEKHAQKLLNKFCTEDIKQYQDLRDFPATPATSTISPYLAAGTISAKQCFIAATSMNNGEFASGNSGSTCWISELLWRDFYKHIIYHFPNLCKGQNFNRKYDHLPWHKPGDALEKWQNGLTGIPIIDAAMRQLVSTGWMHNRLRMVVAMFLTKNLFIDWRHGEKFFSEHLVDLDFASNNGGWQWSASTGTDAVPYFRIFNPITQSERFDPHGEFITRFCPELVGLTAKQIHDPSYHLTSLDLNLIGYPEKMVDISKTRLQAIEYFKSRY